MDELIEKNRIAIIRIASEHGAGNVRLFGSRARGEARPDSDVDLLVDIVGPTTPWFPGGLIEDLEKLLGKHVDVGTVKQLDRLIREDVLKEAIPL